MNCIRCNWAVGSTECYWEHLGDSITGGSVDRKVNCIRFKSGKEVNIVSRSLSTRKGYFPTYELSDSVNHISPLKR